MIRSFIALEISDNTKNNLKNVIAKLDASKADVKWVSTVNLHITLKFLGNVREEDIPEISRIIKESSSDIEPFGLEIKGSGAFPNLKNPRVIFVNIVDECSNLSKLYNRLEDKLSYLGIKKESRKYVPHLTIGRVRSHKQIVKLVNTIEMQKDDFIGSEQIGSIDLMMSELLPKGPKYTRLDAVKLEKCENDMIG